MNILNDFKSALRCPPILPPAFLECALLGTVNHPDTISSYHTLLTVEAFGTHCFPTPMCYELQPLNCALLLLTQNGSGVFKNAQNTIHLSESDLLFFDCKSPFSLSVSGTSWSFVSYFLTGSIVDTFSKALTKCQMPIHLSEYSALLNHFVLLEETERYQLARDPLADLTYFSAIFCDMAAIEQASQKNAAAFPDYLSYMKNCFDYSYDKNYTLTDFEQKLEISKYRLCRDFSNTFGISPLQYLNRKRLLAASELLCTTSIPVHEIGTYVGFTDTNHFIHLFKRMKGITPNAYRQQCLAEK